MNLPEEIVDNIIKMRPYDNYWVYGLTGTGKSYSLYNTQRYNINKMSYGCNLQLYGYIDKNTYLAFDDMDYKDTWRKILKRKQMKTLFEKNEIQYYDYIIDNKECKHESDFHNYIINNMGKLPFKRNKITNPNIIITSYDPPDIKLLGKKWFKIINSRFEIISIENWLKLNNLNLPNS